MLAIRNKLYSTIKNKQQSRLSVINKLTFSIPLSLLVVSMLVGSQACINYDSLHSTVKSLAEGIMFITLDVNCV